MSLHLIRLPLDRRAFYEWAGERGLGSGRFFDEGAALHVLLAGMFGKGALQPFRLFAPGRERMASLYGYAQTDPAELLESARLAAPPESLRVLDLARLDHKPMPLESLSAGKRLGFDLRARPTRRGTDETRGGVPRERDAWQVAADRATAKGAPEPRREAVYAQWLAERLTDAAEIEACRLAGFQRARVWRGDGGARGGHEGPDATLQGTLVISDAAAFARLLAGGVGRHKAYGYGMMLLRPPDRAPLSG